MTAQSDLQFKVMEILRETIQRDVGLDEALLTSGLIDSIGAVDLVLNIEKEFGVEIPAIEIPEHLVKEKRLDMPERTRPIGTW